MYSNRRNFRVLQEIGSRNVTSDFRPFRACTMHPAIIIGTVQSLWTWLWGRYHVPQNVFLVNILHLLVEAKNSNLWYILSKDVGNIIKWTSQAAGDWSVGIKKCVLLSLTSFDRLVHWATRRPTNQPARARRWRPVYSVAQWAASLRQSTCRETTSLFPQSHNAARHALQVARSSCRWMQINVRWHPRTRRCQAKATRFASQPHIIQTSPQGLSTLAATQ